MFMLVSTSNDGCYIILLVNYNIKKLTLIIILDFSCGMANRVHQWCNSAVRKQFVFYYIWLGKNSALEFNAQKWYSIFLTVIKYFNIQTISAYVIHILITRTNLINESVGSKQKLLQCNNIT